MRSLTYIEVDISFCSLVYGVAPCTASLVSSPPTGTIKCFNCRATCQDIANFDPEDVTLRFAKTANYLPREIECIPSIDAVSYTPATISLGKNLGTRATLSVAFKDHPHSDTGDGYDKYLLERTYDPYSQGTYWGKFRARQPFLRGQPVRWITGLLGDSIDDMETRHFVIDSFDGPTPDGKYTINAKDVLKYADGDRAQAPELSNGFLSADITISATSAALLPSGIGNEEYPASGYLNIGGNEIVSFTRSGDALTIVRGQVGTTATTHKAQDRCQLVLRYVGQDVAVIINDLLTTYAGVPSSYITLADWQSETSSFLGTVYTANICEPTSVKNLIDELIEQAALAIWDDNLTQKIRFQVLRGVLTDADTFTPDNTIEKSLTIKEQPETRLSRVQIYFGQKDPTKPLSNVDNYRSTSLVIDEDAEDDYGSAAIKTIYSRWIPEAGRSIADRLGAIILGRFRDPPRRLTFATARYAETDVDAGQGYRVESFCVQDATGAQSDIPIQVTRLNPGPDRFSVEAEEMLWSAPDADLSNRLIIIDANINNINLRTSHDSIYPAPISGDEITCTINSGVIVGSDSTVTPSLDIGTWTSGVTINLVVLGRVEGRGGNAGGGGNFSSGTQGLVGGPALYTRYPINLEVVSGQIWGGGGGGGGGAGRPYGGGGGGGAGKQPGVRGNGPDSATDGTDGEFDVGGAPGLPLGDGSGGAGGAGGNPGLPGSPGISRSPFSGGAGGASGSAIDGASYVTVASGPGDIRGSQIN
jgi:hypothetical protein